MRARRAIIGAVAFASAVVLAAAPVAHAQAPTSGPWAGSYWSEDPPPTEYTTDPVFDGQFQLDNPPCSGLYCEWIGKISYAAEFTDAADERPECPHPPDGQLYNAPNPSQRFGFTPFFKCNGTYNIAVTGYRYHSNGSSAPNDTYMLWRGAVKIAVPAKPVETMTATFAGTDVKVSWVPPAEYDNPDTTPSDLIGYQVNRIAVPTGTTVSLGEIPLNTTVIADPKVPPGTYKYQVQSLREGADPSELTTDTDLVVAANAPPASSSGTSPPTTTPTSTSDAATATATASATGAAVPPRTTRTAPRNVAPVDAETDEEFSSDLPYEPEPGDVSAQAPRVRASNHGPGSWLIVPFAAASVLTMWALIILYVTRQARYAEAGLLPVPLITSDSSESAPDLSSGSFQLPHLGDWMHEGHPVLQPQPVRTAKVALRWRSAASNPSSAIPAPPE